MSLRPLVAASLVASSSLLLAACASSSVTTRAGYASSAPSVRATTGATQEGYASYYADSLAGRSTASGEPYEPALMTAAHRTLPLGTRVRVTRTDSSRVVTVRINDRGPYAGRQRIIDLSRAAAEALSMIRAGVVPVLVEVLSTPPRRAENEHGAF